MEDKLILFSSSKDNKIGKIRMNILIMMMNI